MSLVLKVDDFIDRFDHSIDRFYTADLPYRNFLHGASIHFHERLVQVLRSHTAPVSQWLLDDSLFVELLYALLASWGMDSGQAHLGDFHEFDSAVRTLVASDVFRSMEGHQIAEVDASWRERLTTLWERLEGDCRIMASSSILVGSSKLLHHLLPDLIPPVDRKYTLFLMSHLDHMAYKITTTAAGDPGLEEFLRAMLFFGHVAKNCGSISRHVRPDRLMAGSVPKVIDNAVIAFVAPHLTAR